MNTFNPTHIATNEQEAVEIVTPCQWLGGMPLVRRKDGYEWFSEVKAVPGQKPDMTADEIREENEAMHKHDLDSFWKDPDYH